MSTRPPMLSAPKPVGRLPWESAPARGVMKQTRTGGTILGQAAGFLPGPAPTSTSAVVALPRDQLPLEAMLENATVSYYEGPLND